jgi:general secretion pathway protein A
VTFTSELLESLAELVMSGYQRYSWGGVEVGGILLGKKEPNAIHVSAFRPIDCEHEQGPSFLLSKRDIDSFDQLLAGVGSEEDLNGLVPVGWYYSISRRDFSPSDHDRVLHDRFFPESWKLAMVLQRSKKDPLSIGLFCRGSKGSLEAHSPQREFEIENFRIRWREAPPMAPPEVAPPEDIAAEAPLTVEPPSETQASAIELPNVSPASLENRYGLLGLAEDPFSPEPDPPSYPTPQHKEALARLNHVIQHDQGFLARMGATEAGKSLVLECLIEHQKVTSIEFAFFFNSEISPEEFFDLLAQDLDLRGLNRSSILIALNEYLLRRSQGGQTTVLVVDNAQKLGVNLLDEIELLGSLENRRGRLPQVIFAAQANFERQLEEAEMRDLQQRLLVSSQPAELDVKQTSEYVESRLAQAGLTHQKVFPPQLLLELHARTHGVPRLIDAVCSNLLTLCLEANTNQVDIEMLDRVSAELELDRRVTDASEGAPVMEETA